MINLPTSLPLAYQCNDKRLALMLASGVMGDALDPDAAAYIALVEAADGQALESGVRAEYSKFVAKQKARPSGVSGRSQWESMQTGFIAIHCGQRSLAGLQIPLTGPAPTNTNFVSGDYSRTMGLKGDGTGKSLSYNVLGTSIPTLDRSLGVYHTEHFSRNATRAAMGNGTGSNSDSLVCTGTVRIWRLVGSFQVNDATIPAGYFGASKSMAGQINSRFAGVTEASPVDDLAVTGNMMSVFARATQDMSNGRIIMSHFCLALDMAALEEDVAQLQAGIIAALS